MTVEQLDLDDALAAATAAIDGAADLDALERTRVAFTGRRSDLAALQKQLGGMDPEQRRQLGAAVNHFRTRFDEHFAARRAALETEAVTARIEHERVDVTAPPRRVPRGHAHLLSQVGDEIVDVMIGLGYQVAEGPEVEDAVFNFDLVNIPADHPARQKMDTVYVDQAAGILLRTHTTPVQARVLMTQPLPIAVVVPGRVYRNDAPDPTHSPVFQQIEGLAVGYGITMADLRGTLEALARALFGDDRVIRLRPSFFPFTEPSAEVDVSCPFCSGPGSVCRVCSGTGWIEILGAGMVDADMIAAFGHDPFEVSGFAFGIGIERVAMLRHGVNDIRELYENDARFLERF